MTIYDRDITSPHSDSPTVRAIEELLDAGKTQRDIAAHLGLAQSTVNKYIQRARAIQPGPDWGLGHAKLVAPATTKGDEVVAFLSDTHFPWQNQRMILSSLRLLGDLKPHRVVLNGDINDFFQLSRFNKGLDRLDTLQAEIDEGNEFRAAVRKTCPDAIIDETEGNHDSRLRTYVQTEARAMVSLRNLHMENLLDWAVNEINPHGENGFRLREAFLVKHGTIVRSGVGVTAKAEHGASGISGVSGHTHRLGSYKKSGYVQREWYEGGCLCRLDPDYVKGGVADWQNGMLVGTFTQKGSFNIEEVARLGDNLIFGGRRY